MKYIVSYKTKFGTIAAESRRADDLVVGYESLKQIAAKLEENVSHGIRFKQRRAAAKNSAKRGRGNGSGIKRGVSGGRGETTNIIREIESKLLSSAFFTSPRSTGETKEKLDASSGGEYTSRKVSQALGILWRKKLLKRSGTRNYFVYSK